MGVLTLALLTPDGARNAEVVRPSKVRWQTLRRHSDARTRGVVATAQPTALTTAYLPSRQAPPQAHECQQVLQAFFASPSLPQLVTALLTRALPLAPSEYEDFLADPEAYICTQIASPWAHVVTSPAPS